MEGGYIAGPRLFISGRPLSQIGGHRDCRRRTDERMSCSCGDALGFSLRIADGVDGVRRAAREELRKGANQLKVMVSGGVASPNEPLEGGQYSTEELPGDRRGDRRARRFEDRLRRANAPHPRGARAVGCRGVPRAARDAEAGSSTAGGSARDRGLKARGRAAWLRHRPARDCARGAEPGISAAQ